MAGTASGLNVYMVDRDLPGVSVTQLLAMQQVQIEVSQQFTADGRPIHYLRSLFIVGEARCLCLFAATDTALVEAVNVSAHLPFTRIVEAVDLTP